MTREERQALERRRRTVALGALALTAAAAGTWWLLTGPAVQIATVRLTGYSGPDRAQVEQVVAAVADGGTMVRPPVQRMRRELVARFPWIADVHVARDWPRSLAVQVEMARPAAVLDVAGGPPIAVSAAGRVLGPARAGARLPTIRVRRAPSGTRLRGTGERAAMAFLGALSPPVAARVRDLRIARGGMRARLTNGPDLRLGPVFRLYEKAQVLDAVVERADPAELRRATYLDLSVPTRPALGGVGSTGPDGQGGGDAEAPPDQ